MKPLTCPQCGDHLQAADPGVTTNDSDRRTYHVCPLADEHPFVELQPTEQLAYEQH